MDLETRLRAMEITATVAGGAVRGSMRNRKVELNIDSDEVYDNSDPETLAWQLSRLLTLLFDNRRQGHWRAVSASAGYPIQGRMAAPTPRHDEFRQKQADLLLSGASDDQRIVVESVGLRQFSVDLTADVINSLDWRAFRSGFRAAVDDLWMDYREACRRLRREVGLS